MDGLENLKWAGKKVCVSCVDDADLRAFIESESKPSKCSFCKGAVSQCLDLTNLASFVKFRIEQFYGRAADLLPLEDGGGYIRKTKDTHDLLFDTINLVLPLDSQHNLATALVECIGDDAWCDLDWLDLSFDEHLEARWHSFSFIVKHHRRYFFHELGGEKNGSPQELSFGNFLHELTRLIDELSLVKMVPKASLLYRGRNRRAGKKHKSLQQIGLPPARLALTPSRMNPPGIPMFYCADSEDLVVAELKSPLLSIGVFEVNSELEILDLIDLPPIPGFFSNASKRKILGLTFLHRFAELISQPVDKGRRTVLDYIPTQVFTEYLRDFDFDFGKLRGIKYRSATGLPGANYVLFLTTDDLGLSEGNILECNPCADLSLKEILHKEIFVDS